MAARLLVDGALQYVPIGWSVVGFQRAPGGAAEGADDGPLAGGEVAVVVVEETLEAGGAGAFEHLFEVAGIHRVAIVGGAAGFKPGDDALGILYNGECAERFLCDDLFEEFGCEGGFQIGSIVYTREGKAEEGLDDRQGVGIREAGVPVAEGFYVAPNCANEAVEATVPEVVFWKQEVQEFCELCEIVAAQRCKGGTAGAYAKFDRVAHV